MMVCLLCYRALARIKKEMNSMLLAHLEGSQRKPVFGTEKKFPEIHTLNKLDKNDETKLTPSPFHKKNVFCAMATHTRCKRYLLMIVLHYLGVIIPKFSYICFSKILGYLSTGNLNT